MSYLTNPYCIILHSTCISSYLIIVPHNVTVNAKCHLCHLVSSYLTSPYHTSYLISSGLISPPSRSNDSHLFSSNLTSFHLIWSGLISPPSRSNDSHLFSSNLTSFHLIWSGLVSPPSRSNDSHLFSSDLLSFHCPTDAYQNQVELEREKREKVEKEAAELRSKFLDYASYKVALPF